MTAQGSFSRSHIYGIKAPQEIVILMCENRAEEKH